MSHQGQRETRHYHTSVCIHISKCVRIKWSWWYFILLCNFEQYKEKLRNVKQYYTH